MYCRKCGAEIMDEAVICPKCGCLTDNEKRLKSQNSERVSVIKLFMILGCIVSGIVVFPLLWTIPMTISYKKSVESNQPVSLTFKICTLLFVSTIAGILMLVDEG